MRKRLQKAFMLIALFSFSIGYLGAARWASQIVTEADRVWDENLTLEETITVSGDVTIGAAATDVTVSVSKSKVTIKPYNASKTAFGLEYGQLIFNPLLGRKINVELFCDLEFTGSKGGGVTKDVDMIVTFSGRGQTIFKLNDRYLGVVGRGEAYNRGIQVYFNGYSAGDPLQKVPTIYEQAGTKVYIVMDQTSTDALDNGINKVTFQRMSYAGTEGGTPAYNTYATGVRVGPASFITYLSDNMSGELPTESKVGFGSLAFDPTHAGSGRMYLIIDGASTQAQRFNDGAVIVYGHYVPDFEAATIRKSVALNLVAGVKALFRVVDTLAYNNATKPYNPADSAAKGLLVINLNTTMPKLASDPFQEFGLLAEKTPYWAQDFAWIVAPYAADTYVPANPYNLVDATTYPKLFNVQTGFVLGINGWMDVYHKTFVDYVAACNNAFDAFTYADFDDYYTPAIPEQLLKQHNPSAFFVDNLYPDNNVYQKEQYFTADSHARTIFFGDGRLYLRSGVDNLGLINRQEDEQGYFSAGFGPFFDTTTQTWVFTFSIDKQAYDGRMIPSDFVTIDDGEHVLDVEGMWSVYTRLRNEAPARTQYTAAAITEKGTINMPTVTIDYTGREVDGASYIERPLVKDHEYEVYNSPSMLFNLTPASFYDTKIEHNDVLKVIGRNVATAEPAMVGGEISHLNFLVWPALFGIPTYFEYYEIPKLRFLNSDLNMHESLAAAGLRFMVTELTQNLDPATKFLTEIPVYATNANNTSIFKFFDHGDDLDTLGLAPYGRVFMAGSRLNRTGAYSDEADQRYTWADMERTTLWGFRTSKVESPNVAADTIKLSLQSAYDPDALNRYPLMDPADIQRAHHLFLLQNDITYGANSFMSLGWTTTKANDYYLPWEGKLPWGSDEFSITAPVNESQIPNSYVQPATLSVDGNYIYFGGFDENLNKSTVPVVSFAEGSRLYVNHGGRIQATQPATGLVSVVNGRHGYDTLMDLQIAYRLWDTEGLCGVVDLPKDQVIFHDKYGTQPYDLNTNLFSGNLRLRAQYGSYTANYSQRIAADRSAGEEYTLVWNKRAYNQNSVPVKNTRGADNFNVNFVKNGKFANQLTRFTGIVDDPVILPENLVCFTTGDVINQLKVLGATLADPMMLLIDGAGTNYQAGWVKEIVSQASHPEVPGEGAHAAIFLRNGGRVGLGSMGWDEHSAPWAWNLLGRDYVTICPDGTTFSHEDTTLVTGVVDVNSDLIVTDPLALVPTWGFGWYGPEKLIIRSDDVHEIRIPAGQALDLSSFGQNWFQQQIEFGGKIRLVFEEGATLRLPDDNKVYGGVVLYFNDDAELVFEGADRIQYERYSNLAAADWEKVKIVGSGEIWMNKNAKIEVMAPSKVSVRCDQYTPHTRLAVSLQRASKFMIGNETLAGGAFEIGNPTSLTLTTTPYVDFTMLLGGLTNVSSSAIFQLNRQGFLGINVGIVNKESPRPNGNATIDFNPLVDETDGHFEWYPDTFNAWQVAPLYYTRNCLIRVIEGSFYHANAFNGADERASLMAINPVDGGFGIELADGSNDSNSKIYGGGNVMYPWYYAWNYQTEQYERAQRITVNLWNYQDTIYPYFNWRWNDWDEYEGTWAMYGVFGAGQIMTRADVLSFGTELFPSSTVERTDLSGIDFLTTSVADFWRFITIPPYYTNLEGVNYVSANSIVTLGVTPYDTIVPYVAIQNATTEEAQQIIRDANPDVAGGTAEEARERGILLGSDENYLGPIKFALMENSEG